MTLQPLADAPIARWVGMLAPARQLAEVLAGTQFVPTAMRGDPDAIAAAILYGDELGIEPMQSLASIHVVEGKPQPSSELMRALILKAGHSLAVHEMTHTRVRVSGLRQGRPDQERVYVEWTLDMARAAGLATRPPWRAYPRAMLLARAFGDLARTLFPDVLKGLSYVAEVEDTILDMDTWAGPLDDQAAVAPEPPRKAIQRTRRPKAAQTPDDRPPVAPVDESEPPPSGPSNAGHATSGQTVGPDDVAPPYPRGHQPDDQPLPPDLRPTGSGEPIRPQPDLMPERPAPGPIGTGMVQALNIMLTGQLGSAATREERLSMLSAILGRKVESSKNMTVAEGHLVRDWFGRLEAGTVAFDQDVETGAISVRDVTP